MLAVNTNVALQIRTAAVDLSSDQAIVRFCDSLKLKTNNEVIQEIQSAGDAITKESSKVFGANAENYKIQLLAAIGLLGMAQFSQGGDREIVASKAYNMAEVGTKIIVEMSSARKLGPLTQAKFDSISNNIVNTQTPDKLSIPDVAKLLKSTQAEIAERGINLKDDISFRRYNASKANIYALSQFLGNNLARIEGQLPQPSVATIDLSSGPAIVKFWDSLKNKANEAIALELDKVRRQLVAERIETTFGEGSYRGWMKESNPAMGLLRRTQRALNDEPQTALIAYNMGEQANSIAFEVVKARKDGALTEEKFASITRQVLESQQVDKMSSADRSKLKDDAQANLEQRGTKVNDQMSISNYLSYRSAMYALVQYLGKKLVEAEGGKREK